MNKILPQINKPSQTQSKTNCPIYPSGLWSTINIWNPRVWILDKTSLVWFPNSSDFGAVWNLNEIVLFVEHKNQFQTGLNQFWTGFCSNLFGWSQTSEIRTSDNRTKFRSVSYTERSDFGHSLYVFSKIEKGIKNWNGNFWDSGIQVPAGIQMF